MPDLTSLTPDQKSHPLGRIFGVPLVAVGWDALPWTFPLAALVLAAISGQRHPAWSNRKRLAAGLLSTPLVLGSEWCHNLAHAAAASAIHKPVSAIRLLGGMPRLVYYEPEAEDVSPQQHLVRTGVGPLTNALIWLLTRLLHPFTPPDSLRRDVLSLCQGMNGIIATFGLAPHPAFDGGPLLKWSLITHGLSPARADQVVRQANLVAGSGALVGAAVCLRPPRKNLFLAGMFGLMGMACLSVLFTQDKP